MEMLSGFRWGIGMTVQSLTANKIFTLTEYEFIDDLLELDRKRKFPTPPVPPELLPNPSPLQAEAWRLSLMEHPDVRLREYVVKVIQDGFRIGFDYHNHSCKRAKKNMLSAFDHTEIVNKYIAEECAAGKLLGPFDPASLPSVQTSTFGVIPKSTQGKWRLILDLLSPEGHSVNDGIDQDLCSLSYIKVDDVAKAPVTLGQGALLAKVDIKNAYRMVPVHPEDRPLLGMIWDEALYVDTSLLFGLRSAPKEQLKILLAVFERLNIPVVVEKLEGPTTVLIFLGIKMDTKNLILRLPKEKLCKLHGLIATWRDKRWCTKSELRSLVGKLQHT